LTNYNTGTVITVQYMAHLFSHLDFEINSAFSYLGPKKVNAVPFFKFFSLLYYSSPLPLSAQKPADSATSAKSAPATNGKSADKALTNGKAATDKALTNGKAETCKSSNKSGQSADVQKSKEKDLVKDKEKSDKDKEKEEDEVKGKKKPANRIVSSDESGSSSESDGDSSGTGNTFHQVPGVPGVLNPGRILLFCYLIKNFRPDPVLNSIFRYCFSKPFKSNGS
jgi:hypothetical protein